jgi:hypothetical protein
MRAPFNRGRPMTLTRTSVPNEFLTRGYSFDDVGSAGATIHFGEDVLDELYQVMDDIEVLR